MHTESGSLYPKSFNLGSISAKIQTEAQSKLHYMLSQAYDILLDCTHLSMRLRDYTVLMPCSSLASDYHAM